MPRVKRQARFRGKVLDGLRLAIFEDLKAVLGQIGDEAAFLIFHVEKELDHINAGFEGGDGGLIGVFVFIFFGLGGGLLVLGIGDHLHVLGEDEAGKQAIRSNRSRNLGGQESALAA